jgi:hypothetical protein
MDADVFICNNTPCIVGFPGILTQVLFQNSSPKYYFVYLELKTTHIHQKVASYKLEHIFHLVLRSKFEKVSQIKTTVWMLELKMRFSSDWM